MLNITWQHPTEFRFTLLNFERYSYYNKNCFKLFLSLFIHVCLRLWPSYWYKMHWRSQFLAHSVCSYVSGSFFGKNDSHYETDDDEDEKSKKSSAVHHDSAVFFRLVQTMLNIDDEMTKTGSEIRLFIDALTWKQLFGRMFWEWVGTNYVNYLDL